jgi:hypothetical protein
VGFEFGRYAGCPVAHDIGDGYRRSRLAQREGECSSDTLTGAGDQCGFTGEAESFEHGFCSEYGIVRKRLVHDCPPQFERFYST